MSNFQRRSIEVANAGVYNPRIHHDRVVMPLIRDRDIENLTGLRPAAADFMMLPAKIMEKAEIFERRVGISLA